MDAGVRGAGSQFVPDGQAARVGEDVRRRAHREHVQAQGLSGGQEERAGLRRAGLEITGLVVCVMGFLLMIAALVALGRNYQLGGSAPRSEDALVVAGPFRLIRHPMYTAALGISLGLACLIQSWILLGVFAIYVVLILLLVPIEEDGLRQAYGEPYDAYRQATRKLIPFVY